MAALPDAVLFACNLNRVRSPMAAALMRRRWGDRVYVDSCGLTAAETPDPFAVAVMQEIGLDLSAHVPKSFDTLGDGSFDLVVSLTAQAHARAERLARGRAMEALHWPVEDPTEGEGSRTEKLGVYRRVRDALERRITERFP